MDKFIGCQFKELRKASYFNNKLAFNVSNFGAKKEDILYIGRNGEYFNISIQLNEPIKCQFNDVNVHKIYLNIESNYTNNMELMDKFNLVSLYQKYQNDIFRYIVDKFLELNDITEFYSDYSNLTNNLTKDNDLINLTKKIIEDRHELLPVSFKVTNCGSLLPESWLYKEFNSGKDFHERIDKLECRINKPPVTYLCNYSMLISQTKLEPKISLIKNYENMWIANSTGKFIKINKLPTNNNLTWVSVNYKDKPIYFLYEPTNVFDQNVVQQSISISYNCSLLQKSIRRGIECHDSLIDSINSLSFAKPFNNPEYNYALVSGSKQLLWRLFISILEDVCIYKSEKELDIFDLVAYSYIFSNYPEKSIHNKITQKVKQLGTKLLLLKNYVNFRKYKESNNMQINHKYHLALFIAHDYLPGMTGDKRMIRSLETWLTNCDNQLDIMYDLDSMIFNEYLIKPNTISNFILKCTANDHHCNPEIISDYHNLLYDGKITTEQCAGLIWDYNSSYNYRYHEFKCNEDLLFIQLLNNKNNKSFFDKNLIIKDKLLNNVSDTNYQIILNLTNNLIHYEYQHLNFVNELLNLKIINTTCDTTALNYKNIIQIILSNSFINYFTFHGRKTIPIYTFNKIKFKIGDSIFTFEDDESQYTKIFAKYVNTINGITIKLDKYTKSICNFAKDNIKLEYNNNTILFDNKPIVKINNKYEYVIIIQELDNFIVKTKIVNYSITSSNYIYQLLKSIIDVKSSKIDLWINQKILSKPHIDSDYIINSDLIKFINPIVKKIIISRILTALDDKTNKTVLLCGKVNREGNSNKESVDQIHEGYLMRMLNLLNVLFGCVCKISNTKYLINKRTQSFSFMINELKKIHIDNELIKTNNSQTIFPKKNQTEKNNIIVVNDIDNINTNNQFIVKTKLWNHQEKVCSEIITGINKFNQRGFGDASDVGSGKTLTALSIMEILDKKTITITNFLVLIPNDNLFKVWNDEIKTHCQGVQTYNQNSQGKWSSLFQKSKTNIWITTMGRNRDHPLNIFFDFVVIDECLTVQNKDSKWTMKAFEQAVGSKYGILMLSATFFRTRFDKLFFMLKMLDCGIPERPEYLDTILNTVIEANIKINKKIWTITYQKVKLSLNFYKKYNSLKTSNNNNKMDAYINLQNYMNKNIDYAKIIIDRINFLLSEKKKIIYFAQSNTEITALENYVNENSVKNIGFYPNINNDVCIITIHTGSYGINNLTNYNTILLRPTEPDKIPQIKGRIDRPNQKSINLYLEYIIVKDTIEEIDLIKLEMANTFYKNHIIPLASYYDKYL